MPVATSSVTVTMVIAWALAARRAWVPGSVDRSQSQKPVSAASTDTTPPAMSKKEAAR